MKTYKFPWLLLLLLTSCVQEKSAAQSMPPWTITVRIVDDLGQPVPGANVELLYGATRKPNQSEAWSKLTGVADASGTFTTNHAYTSHSIGIKVAKAGYYGTTFSYELGFTYTPAKWNAEVAIPLKRVMHPIPMFVSKVDFPHSEAPALDKSLGFDLKAGDFVAPYGKGESAHMFFTWHKETITNGVSGHAETGWKDTLTINFPHPGDGIQVFSTSAGPRSELVSPEEAPADDYTAQLVKIRSWYPDRPGTNNYDHIHLNYLLRVETVLDEHGVVRSANYGKIYGDFDERILTYLNPEPNSRDIEFDGKHNLGSGGVSGWARY